MLIIMYLNDPHSIQIIVHFIYRRKLTFIHVVVCVGRIDYKLKIRVKHEQIVCQMEKSSAGRPFRK